MKQQSNAHIVIIYSLFVVMCAVFYYAYSQATMQNRQVANELVEISRTLQQQATPPSSPTAPVARDHQAAQTDAMTAANPAAPSPASVATVFDNIAASDEENIRLNALKTEFESLFVTYQYLKTCGATEADDYHLLNSALMHRISSLNAAGRVQYDILTAAKGTYAEIYARSECDVTTLPDMQKKFRDYIENSKKLNFVIG